MKKLSIILLTILSLAFVSAEAKQGNHLKLQQCPFTDNFYIAGGLITSLSANNIAVTKVSPTEFTTGCIGNLVNTGDAYVTVNSTTTSGSCTLDVQDGAYMMNPNVASANCQGGMQYTGMDHAFGTYDYTLKFTG